MTRQAIITWQPSAQCPANQLEKVADNRYAIICAATTVIKASEEETNTRWVDLGLYDTKSQELDMQSLQGPLQMQQGIRLVSKYLVTYNPQQRRELVKAFNQAGFISFTEIPEGFLLSKNVDKSFLDTINGVVEVTTVTILQRKEVQPTLLPTGISLPQLPWHLLSQLDPYKPYTLAANTFAAVNSPSLYIPVKAATSADYTIVNRGEMIAEILIITNNNKINLVREELKVVGI